MVDLFLVGNIGIVESLWSLYFWLYMFCAYPLSINACFYLQFAARLFRANALAEDRWIKTLINWEAGLEEMMFQATITNISLSSGWLLI